MNAAWVTLASALQVRGEALSEEEIWSVLSLAAERLLEDLRHDSSDYVVCPWSVLLSAAGSLAFQDHVSHLESAPFKAPELLQEPGEDKQTDASQMHVYSLGMTLYWSAAFHVPPNQPLQLREPVHSLLLAMCEDQPRRRRPLTAVLEACRLHQEEVAVYPAPASLHIRRLVGLVLGTLSEAERRVVEEGACEWHGRSCLLRKRLHRASSESPARAPEGLQPCRGARPRDHEEGQRRSSRSVLLAEAESSRPTTPSQRGFLQRKGKFSRPEFILLAGEAPVTLHLPGSIVTKKGKSYLALAELCVVLLSGQCLEVKCDLESTAGAVFHAVMAFANLRETSYFGLAYVKGKEFFFLDDETRLCKIAPEGWREQSPRASTDTFTLFLRIKFFVGHYGLLQHSLTRHQFYLQLRKDILEERLRCDDETLLQLGVLALKAEFGSYPNEVESKAYFRVEDYIPARLVERMTAIRVQVEVSEMHRLSSAPCGEDAELEFLEISQQLPEYGVLVHQVFPEKKSPEGEMALGVCAEGIIVYDVKNSCRVVMSRLPWRETGKISTHRKKLTITSSVTGKKHTFITDSAKTCTYLLGLCLAQHGFNAQMGSGQLPHLLPDHNKFVQITNLSSAPPAQAKPLTWIQRLSCSENELCVPRPQNAVGGPLSTSLENFNVEGGHETGTEGLGGSPCTGREQLDTLSLLPKPTTCDLSGSSVQNVYTGSQNSRRKSFTEEPGQELVCVTLERDPHRGFGGQILALNHIGLEGFTFNMAVRMIQNSPDNIDLVISQSKGACGNIPGEEKNSPANSGVSPTDILSSGCRRSVSSHTHDQNRNMGGLEMAQVQSSSPRQGPMLSPPPLKGQGASSSCPPLPPETKAGEIYFVELVKEDGTLGFSVTGGINTTVPYGGIYVKSIIPGGPAAKEGQILQGDRLLQVDGVSLCGLTHKQAVQCLKGPGQVARLVLERRGHTTAQQCPPNDRMGDEHVAVSLVTAQRGRPVSCVSVTDGPKFEVKLKKSSNGLGFSFVQMEKGSCRHLTSDLVRIKRLFPGQPAEEHGAIAAGDLILAVNGKPTEGLLFQEVLHLLRGSSPEVTLLLCRPPPGVLPEIEQGWQAPVLSADQRFTRMTCTDSEQSPSLDQEDSWRDSASLDMGEGLGPRPESFRKALREAQGDQDRERPWTKSQMQPLELHPHSCRLSKETEVPTLPTSLEKEMRQTCYSVCDLRRLESGGSKDQGSISSLLFASLCPEHPQQECSNLAGSPGMCHGENSERQGENGSGDSHGGWKMHRLLFYSPGLYRGDAEGVPCCPSGTPSLTSEDEEYLTLNLMSEGQLPCAECLEADSETIPLPQCCPWHAVPQSLLREGSCGSESDWEDLEEPVDAGCNALRST